MPSHMTARGKALFAAVAVASILFLSAHPAQGERSFGRLGKRQEPLPFVIREICSGAVTRCNAMVVSLQNAGKRIAKAVKLTTPIIVSVNVISFSAVCRDRPDLRCSSGAPLQAWTIPRSVSQQTFPDNSTWTVPAPLLKQSGAPSSQFLLHDMYMELNADFAPLWWYGDAGGAALVDPGPAPKPPQYDFDQLAVQQLLHGMGLSSSWVPVVQLLPNVTGEPGILVPPFQLNDPYAILNSGDNTIRSWKGSPGLSLYDRYIVLNATGVSTTATAKSITDFQFPANITLAEWYRRFKTSGAPYDQARRMYDLVTAGPGAASFVSNSTTVAPMVLYTPQGTPRGALSSLDLRYNNGPEWIMVFNNTDKTVGKIVDTVLREQGGGYGVIAPGVSSMLVQLGYPAGDLGSGLPAMYGSLTAGELAGVIIGAILGAALLGAGIFFIYRYFHQRKAVDQQFEMKFGDSEFKAGSGVGGSS